MALNFPANPQIDDIYTSGQTTWKWDGAAWNIVSSDTGRNIFTNFSSDSGSASPSLLDDTLEIIGSGSITTSIENKTLTINSDGGSAGDVFKTIISDDGSATATGAEDSLSIIGGTNISTSIATDTKNVSINVNPFPIGELSNVSNTTPTSGQVLKWDGSQWAPGTDVAEGGAGLDADTLDGFNGTYYLDYTNFTNTPSVVTLTDLSVGNELAASGDGAISYNNTTGVFRYTPPDLSAYSTFDGAFSSLTGTPTTIAGYGITDAFDGQYSSLSGAPTIPSDISDLTDTTSLIPTSLLDLSITDGSNGQVLTTDGAGNFTFTTVTGGGGGDGEANQNAFSNIVVSGASTVEADQPSDSLTLVGGTGLTITTNALNDTITFTNDFQQGALVFTDLNDVATGQTVDKFYTNAIVTYQVDNNSTTSYLFEPHYSGDNPTIYVIAGTTVAFDLTEIPGHPFELQDNTLSPLTAGLVHVATDGTVSTNSAAQGKQSGTLYWTINESISGNYAYQCQLHAAMYGTIVVKRLSTI